MRRHLASTRRWIGGSARGLQEHVLGRHAESQAQRAIPIIGENPIVAGAQSQARRDLNRFMPGAADLEKDFILPLEQDLPVVNATGRVHIAIGAYEVFRFQAGGKCRKTGFHGGAHRR